MAKNGLAALRNSRGWTQDDVADKIGMSLGGYRKLEYGERSLKAAQIAMFAKLFGATETEVIHDDGEDDRPQPRRVPVGQEFDPDPEFDNPATMGSETGRQGVPKGSIAEIDVTAGLGAGGLTTVSEATAASGMRFAAEVVRAHWTFPEWFLSRLNLRPEWAALFPSQGDSMFPTILDGDVIVVDTRHRVPSPPGIYALTDMFGGVIFKRLEVVSSPSDPDVMVKVASDNPRHETVVRPLADVYIIGRFVSRMTSDVGR